jgi:WD40 repeat protein
MPANQSAICLSLIAFFAYFPTRLMAQEPTPEQVQSLLAKFQMERAEATKWKLPADALQQADKSAARAEAALKADDLHVAARLARTARWQLPARPTELPEHVRLVIGSVRLRHADRVNGLTYSPDGTKLASASRDGTVRVWDLGNGRELLVYRAHPMPKVVNENTPIDATVALRIPDVAWSPAGDLIASAGGNEIHLWDPATGKLVRTLKKHSGLVTSLAFGPGGKQLLSGSDDKLAILWNVADGEEIFTTSAHADRVEAVALSADGKYIAVGDAAGFVSIHDIAEKKQLQRTPATEGGKQVTGVAITPDGSKLLIGGYDRLARFLAGPAADGGAAPAASLLKFSGHSDNVSAVAITPDGKLVVTAGHDRTVRVWDAVSGKPVRIFQGHLDRVIALAIRPDGGEVASGSEDGSVRLWDLSAVDNHRAATEANDALWAAVYSPDGSHFAAAGADRNIRVYDERGKLLHTLSGHTGAVTSLAFVSADRLASAAGDKLIKIWDPTEGKHIRDLSGHKSAVLALAATRDGRLLSASADKTVRAWAVETGQPQWTWEGKSTSTALAVRPDAKQAAVGTADGTLTILDLTAEPKPTGTVPAHIAGVAAASYSPDGSRLATVGGDGIVKLWSVPDTGTPTTSARFESAMAISTLGSVTALSAVGFSPDGRQVVAGGADGIVRIWDAATGAEARGLRGHTDWVTAAQFSPDGEKVLSAGVDRAVRVFDLERTDLLGHNGHALAAKCVAFHRDGMLIASGSADRTVKVWDLASGREVITLTGLVDTPFTLTFSGPERDRVAAGGAERRLRLWSLADGKEQKSIATGLAYLIMSTPDGGLAVWSRNTSGQDEFTRYTPDGAPIGEALQDKTRPATCASFSKDGTLAVVGSEDGSVRVWDLDKRERLGSDWPILVNAVGDVGLTPDKKTLLVIDAEGEVKVSDLDKREVLHTAKGFDAEVNGLIVSPSGDRFAIFSNAGDVKVFDLTAKELRSWKLPVPANAAAFASDGKSLVTANADGTLYVLDVP